MFRLFTTTSILSAAVGLATLGGCASTNDRAASGASATAAMSCPKCETVWVRDNSSQGTKIQRFASKKQMTCPDCDASATAYLKDGQKVLHDCPRCKVAPTPLAPASAPQPSHPKGTHS